jgi:hypothetical protein
MRSVEQASLVCLWLIPRIALRISYLVSYPVSVLDSCCAFDAACLVCFGDKTPQLIALLSMARGEMAGYAE